MYQYYPFSNIINLLPIMSAMCRERKGESVLEITSQFYNFLWLFSTETNVLHIAQKSLLGSVRKKKQMTCRQRFLRPIYNYMQTQTYVIYCIVQKLSYFYTISHIHFCKQYSLIQKHIKIRDRIIFQNVISKPEDYIQL